MILSECARVKVVQVRDGFGSYRKDRPRTLFSCSLTMMQNKVRFQSIWVNSILPYVEDERTLSLTCKTWRLWMRERPDRRPPRHLRSDEIDTIVDHLKALRLPWTSATEEYTRKALRNTPCFPTDGEDPRTLSMLQDYLCRMYQRAVLSPKTNIGTLSVVLFPNRTTLPDTTRVIERLTQARLSRFHSTGAAGIQQNSSNLDILLHPQQSTRRPQMVVRLDPQRVITQSARRVMEHIRGRLIAIGRV